MKSDTRYSNRRPSVRSERPARDMRAQRTQKEQTVQLTVRGMARGAIRMEAMFIDEGFGTLDQESLQLAIRTLVEQSGPNKLVGIISHVEELKESIDRKIVVTRGRCGSTLRVEA